MAVDPGFESKATKKNSHKEAQRSTKMGAIGEVEHCEVIR